MKITTAQFTHLRPPATRNMRLPRRIIPTPPPHLHLRRSAENAPHNPIMKKPGPQLDRHPLVIRPGRRQHFIHPPSQGQSLARNRSDQPSRNLR